MKSMVFWIGLGLLAGLVLVAGLAFSQPYSLHGSQFDPALPAAEIDLIDGEGQAFRLSEQKGKLVLIFFGYTTCPDVCPATLGEMKQVRDRLKDQADEVEFLFITVDPQRDTPERLGKYVAAFDPAIHGLTGSEEALQKVWADYGVYRQVNDTGSGAGYLVDHTARTYLIDRAGNLRLTFSFGTPLDDVVEDVRFLLKE